MIKFFLKSKFLKKKVFLLSPTIIIIIIIIIKLGYEKKSFKKTTIIYRIKVFHVSFLELARYNTIIQIKKS
jgi:hypothetical protein